jgi:hypothetical protein
MPSFQVFLPCRTGRSLKNNWAVLQRRPTQNFFPSQILTNMSSSLPEGLNYVDVYEDDQCQKLWFTGESNGVRSCHSINSDSQNLGDYPLQGFDISCNTNKITVKPCMASDDIFLQIAIPDSGPTTTCYPIARSVTANPKNYYLRQTCQAGLWSKTGTSSGAGSSGSTTGTESNSVTSGTGSSGSTSGTGSNGATSGTGTNGVTSGTGSQGTSSNSESASSSSTGLIIGKYFRSH